MTEDAINIKSRSQASIALAANTANKSAPLAAGKYDIWCDADVFIRVAPFRRGDVVTAAPNRAEDVTTTNGYQIYAGNVATFDIQEGDVIGAISASVSTLRFMQVG